MSLSSSLKIASVVGGGSLLLAHLLTATAFRRRTQAIIDCLGRASTIEAPPSRVPALVHAFAKRVTCEAPVPNTVRLWQRGEIRTSFRDPWRPFSAEQVIG